jgi:Rrf2 family transcriptional regulator, nitric oxide-sensitive transcriptional repressor
MRLTSFTDYTLRSLIYLGMHRDRLVTIQDIADLHDISKNHLTKVIHQLGVNGLVETVRGRNGGLRLGREPEEINIGAVVRQSESDFFMAECFDSEHNSCVLDGDCYLKFKLKEATEAYLHVLDGLTLAKLLPRAGERLTGEAQPLQFVPRVPVRS